MNYTDIIVAPLITEKASTINAKGNVFVFKVNKKANKNQIKKAIEDAFKVNVINVNTLITKPKDRRVGRYTGKTKTYKKAFVTLKDGQTIEL